VDSCILTKKSRLVLIINSYGREVEMFRKARWVESFRHAQNRSRGGILELELERPRRGVDLEDGHGEHDKTVGGFVDSEMHDVWDGKQVFRCFKQPYLVFLVRKNHKGAEVSLVFFFCALSLVRHHNILCIDGAAVRALECRNMHHATAALRVS